MAIDENQFIYAKAVDRSLLRQGFTLPVKMLWGFKEWFGELKPGMSRDIKVRLDDQEFPVRIGNRNFDREKWPDHPEMYQMRYTEGSAFAEVLRKQFQESDKFIKKVLLERARNGENSKRHIVMPKSGLEYLLFYRTDDPNVWDAEVMLARESIEAAHELRSTSEQAFETADWRDANAGIVMKPAIVKVRKIDRAIGNNLKRVYEHRCQICGEQVAELYSAHVDEVHHIDPFVRSLNNDVSNLLVVCPTHHRIIHAAKPNFVRTELSYHYPNGLVEGLKLNFHLCDRPS